MSDIHAHPGLKTSRTHPLIADLRALVQKHDLYGAVLVTFSKDMRIGVNSSSPTDSFGRAMDELADRILVKIDNGELDPTTI